MTKYDLLSIVDKLDRYDFTKAEFVPLKFEDQMVKVCSKDQGQYFLVYLNRDYGDGVEWIDTVTSYKEAQHLVDELNDWLSEDDFDDDGWGW
jgi:hypothetical protein